jgi:hypothetical protein
LAILSAGLFLFLPFVNLLHHSPWQRSVGFIHGLGIRHSFDEVHYGTFWGIPLRILYIFVGAFVPLNRAVSINNFSDIVATENYTYVDNGVSKTGTRSYGLTAV